MKIGLVGKRLESMQVEYTLVLQLSDAYFIAVSSPLVAEFDGRRTSLSPEKDSKDAFEPVRKLIGRTIEAAEVNSSGTLEARFESGARLVVEPDAAYEAWNVSGPNGQLVVSMPGAS